MIQSIIGIYIKLIIKITECFLVKKILFFFVDILWNSIEINYAISNGEFLNFKELTADCQFKKKKKKNYNAQLTTDAQNYLRHGSY